MDKAPGLLSYGNYRAGKNILIETDSGLLGPLTIQEAKKK